MSRGSGSDPRCAERPDAEAGTGARSGRLGEFAEAYALAAFTVALLIFFSHPAASSATFATADNFRIVAAEQSVLLVVSLAVLVPIVCNAWDFTPGAVAGLAAVFAASTVASSGSILLAILVALGVGLAIGAINGVLVTKFRINSVIATLAMTIVISGIVQWKTDGNTIVNGIPKSLTDFGAGSWLGVPRIAWVAIVAALVLSLVLTRTVFGRRLYAVGSSSSAARLVGLRNERLIFGTYLISGALSAVARGPAAGAHRLGQPAGGPRLHPPRLCRRLPRRLGGVPRTLERLGSGDRGDLPRGPQQRPDPCGGKPVRQQPGQRAGSDRRGGRGQPSGEAPWQKHRVVVIGNTSTGEGELT